MIIYHYNDEIFWFLLFVHMVDYMKNYEGKNNNQLVSHNHQFIVIVLRFFSSIILVNLRFQVNKKTVKTTRYRSHKLQINLRMTLLY